MPFLKQLIWFLRFAEQHISHFTFLFHTASLTVITSSNPFHSLKCHYIVTLVITFSWPNYILTLFLFELWLETGKLSYQPFPHLKVPLLWIPLGLEYLLFELCNVLFIALFHKHLSSAMHWTWLEGCKDEWETDFVLQKLIVENRMWRTLFSYCIYSFIIRR